MSFDLRCWEAAAGLPLVQARPGAKPSGPA